MNAPAATAASALTGSSAATAPTGSTIIDCSGLTKVYRRRRKPDQRAVDGLDLTVREGGVHGFLGPNGSGKTTTIRMLLGLVAADSGQMRLLGRPVPADLPDVLGQVGALVETPLFFPTFSGRRNLRLLADLASIPYSRVEDVLSTVDLADRADDAVKGYSLGMKQRLGIAAALLKRPRLLVLDEPTNGLDPAGIRDVRELIRRLGASGRTTVFLSSHLLAEVQAVCDDVTILAKGRCVASGPVAQVLSGVGGHGVGAGEVRVEIAEPAAAASVLSQRGYAVRPDTAGALRVAGVPDPAAAAELNRTLAGAGLFASGIARVGVDLESAFLALTEGEHPADPTPTGPAATAIGARGIPDRSTTEATR